MSDMESSTLKCTLCGRNCFVSIPPITPKHMLKAYTSRGVTAAATCPDGMELEKKLLGYCYSDFLAHIKGN